ncbi:MBL fold metallo-hydrolase [Campylobacter gastrosuis]|uniref:MBL fold metallo-hydrolase n=1 Tax=Campylobacter gastrosuis TaxID=2974576 RepID=A0ABT7HPN9_9BACT|nr:MBL fold metallo-hydrolase [Campylobacter gastrosuis]MDL0088809.1 MBL fold metallo-hydrolase [Campylobacter gastrosuis]
MRKFTLTKPNSKLAIYGFNPGESGLFAVSSTIIEGQNEIMLVDAQFQKSDAEFLIEYIKNTGKKLKYIYISHFDPDFYFGLGEIASVFADAKIVARPSTISGIKRNLIGKMEYWLPILKERNNAPRFFMLPEPFLDEFFKIDDEKILIKGIKRNEAKTYLFYQEQGVLFGGAWVFGGIHLWTASTPTKQSRAEWIEILNDMIELKPSVVLPAHFLGELDSGVLEFNKEYLNTLEKQISLSKTSAELEAKMREIYPNLKGDSYLEIGSKVVTGEIEWL